MGAPLGNKFAVGNEGGRPPKYDNPTQLWEQVQAYFTWIEGEEDKTTVNAEGDLTLPEKKWLRNPEPATITGLTLFLGFSDRGSLDDYEKKEEFSHIIKRARKIVEYGYELRLGNQSPTGAIFALKNMGWKDKTETEHSGGMSLVWNETKTYDPQQKTDDSA